MARARGNRLYRPMLATAPDTLPRGEEWAYEVKFDGYRALAYLRAGVCTLRSRNDLDLTERFPEPARAIERAAGSPDAVLDGELVRYRRERARELLGAPAGNRRARQLRLRPARARPPTTSPTETRSCALPPSRGSKGSSPSASRARTGRAGAAATG